VTHEIPLERRTLHGHFSCELEPVLTVDPGDSVVFQALMAGWRWEPTHEFSERHDPVRDSGHALVGPIAVRGARAGGTLAVTIDEVVPAGWGVTFGDGDPFGWTIRGGEATNERGVTIATDPFLGVIGMPPPEPGVHPTAPPRRWGGNIDCKLLVAGSTLYLPIPVDGAHVSAGDGHAAQGDGEVSGTAIECPLERARLTLDLRDDMELEMPIARTPAAWVTFGFDEDLDSAAGIAVEAMLDLMERELDTDRKHALALASVGVDVRVTQLVNGALGVHAVLAHDAFRIARMAAS
jgi:acetamidase/formamidase